MPRIRQKQDEYAINDLICEINAQRARIGLNSCDSFGTAIGVCGKSAWNYLKKPDDMRFGVLRAIVQTIKPNPEILLKALGYSNKDIKNMAKTFCSR